MKIIVRPGQQLIILFKIDPYRSSPSFTFPLPKVCRLLKEWVLYVLNKFLFIKS
jgi:hypothetical protein